MLYSFDIQYFEPAVQGLVNVTAILDLPQNSIQNVKVNPFVVDLVNHPFIKAGLKQMPGNQQELVDNIRPFNSIVPNTAVKVSCKYQASSGDSEYKTFVFNISFVYSSCYIPSNNPLVFTCGCLYDAYERLFQSGHYVLTPRIPNVQYGWTVGHYYLCELLGACELMEVTRCTNNGILVDSVAENGTISSISLNQNCIGQLRPIRLNDQLMTMMGFNYVNNKSIYGLTGVNFFEGVLNCNGTAAFQVFVKRDTVGYSLIVYDSAANNNCRLLKCFYLHELQELLQKEYHASIRLAQSQLISICQFMNDTTRHAKIVSQIYSVISLCYLQNQPSKPTRGQIITYVASHFGITPQEAQNIMALMHC